jgi:hypothetical protein
MKKEEEIKSVEQLPEIRTLEQLQKEFDKVFLMEDKGVIPFLCAVTIANQMDGDSVWAMLISPSSGGKTELLQSLSLITHRGKPVCFAVSDLTVNTFASGQKKAGKETSLLHKMPPGSMMIFKDFTSMISKNHDAQKEIMGQLREIHDGDYVKRTGTGFDITWKGKVGAIAGCTEVIYISNEEFSAMGDRFIMYKMIQPPRLDALKLVIDRMSDKSNVYKDSREYLKLCMKSFVEFHFDNIEGTDIELLPETRSEMLEIIDFVAMVSSGVMTDKRTGVVQFVPSHAMPMRMAKQILSIVKAFVLINKNTPGVLEGSPAYKGGLTVDQTQTVYKICLDTIPIVRRMALQQLAKYTLGVTTSGLATSLNYPTPVVGQWLSQLNALGICSREKTGKGDKWTLNDKYRNIMIKFEKIEVVEGELDADDDGVYSLDIKNSKGASLNPAGSIDPIGDSEYQHEQATKEFESF